MWRAPRVKAARTFKFRVISENPRVTQTSSTLPWLEDSAGGWTEGFALDSFPGWDDFSRMFDEFKPIRCSVRYRLQGIESDPGVEISDGKDSITLAYVEDADDEGLLTMTQMQQRRYRTHTFSRMGAAKSFRIPVMANFPVAGPGDAISALSGVRRAPWLDIGMASSTRWGLLKFNMFTTSNNKGTKFLFMRDYVCEFAFRVKR